MDSHMLAGEMQSLHFTRFFHGRGVGSDVRADRNV